MFQLYKDWREKHKLVKDIRRNGWSIYDHNYSTLEEATAKLQNLYNSIYAAEDFNKRTLTKKIDTERFRDGAMLLEQTVEEDFFAALLDIK